ncbi:MAG TPA: hypothetical protein VF795_06790 [Desulfuromonadaceae bacterium]
MILAQISPNSVTVNPAHSNPQVRTDQSATTTTANQTAEQGIKKTKTDTVTISRRAAQMAAQTHAPAERPKGGQVVKPSGRINITA